MTATAPASALPRQGPGAGAPPGTAPVDVVIPTVGRPSLGALLWVMCRALPAGGRVIVVDDRARPTAPLDLGLDDGRVTVVATGGRGPAAARNAGWAASTAPWVAFVDDDVEPPLSWVRDLCEDVRGAAPGVGAVQGRIVVPLPGDRRPTDWERNVAGLDGATWITADMAVRRTALEAVGGFDERFPRAYREDTDLALRLLDAGWQLAVGDRRARHPVGPAPWWTSVRLQRGNADDVLLERLHGPGWRARVGAPAGAFGRYPATTGLLAAAAVATATGRRRAAAVAGAWWAARTARLAWQRIAPGPRTPREVATMVATSVAIPPAACWHRARGRLRWRSAAARRPVAPAR
ncbi:MAG TPA: glycosyltransferase [Acidimicrobiales bacterium]|nr:glycosyltransferase [Acidimicrobiales bacterium]